MADVVNLNRHRKRAERERMAASAAENRSRFGRTKSERTQDETLATRRQKILDQHRIDGEDAS